MLALCLVCVGACLECVAAPVRAGEPNVAKWQCPRRRRPRGSLHAPFPARQPGNTHQSRCTPAALNLWIHILAEHLVEFAAGITVREFGERPLLRHLLRCPHEAGPRDPRQRAADAAQTPCRHLKRGAVRYPNVLLDVDLSQCSFCELADGQMAIPDAGSLGLDNAPLLTTV